MKKLSAIPITKQPPSAIYAYNKAIASRSTCPCGNSASRRFGGMPCCERCYEWETRYEHTKKCTGRKPVAGHIAGPEEEYRVMNMGAKSNLYKELR